MDELVERARDGESASLVGYTGFKSDGIAIDSYEYSLNYKIIFFSKRNNNEIVHYNFTNLK